MASTHATHSWTRPCANLAVTLPGHPIKSRLCQGLNEPQANDAVSQISFEPTDVVVAVSVDGATPAESPEPPSFATDFQAIVEQCVRPLVEEVKAQTLALAEKDRMIEEQGRQLRMLPDLQKRAEEERQLAETERKAAEIRALEVEALSKQITAMEQERQELQAKAAKLRNWPPICKP